ncbi:Lrp/AsnC family transcriptional regulator [Marivibrio halodurans]|uniref:Lrp/AsnC family transcriptional regulator n=1 Tax=Marivibrio halodurans TaxID=2039722 RepID=A0A8J7S0G4_9PROT|nr:Lrp/AsnC family transcriptional regulator [Marivibrio halodurans]MBP5858077.1 Lrp/AsnC family transcriptional regulator [Marivibrio halodurans]
MDHMIARALREDARQSFRALGRNVGLSTPAAAERVRRLERMGVLRGYRAQVDRAALGRPVTAYLTLTCPGDRAAAALSAARASPDILEYHRVAGTASVMMKAAVRDLAALDALAERFRLIAPTEVSVVLSSAFEQEDRP